MTSTEYIQKSSQRGWRFHVSIPDSDIRNLCYVHPLKQRLVNQIVLRAKSDESINRIIIFGSAITNRCNPFSDLDLCIDWKLPSHDEDGVFVPETRSMMKFISSITQGKADVLAYDDVDNEMMKQQIDEGVIVYEYNV